MIESKQDDLIDPRSDSELYTEDDNLSSSDDDTIAKSFQTHNLGHGATKKEFSTLSRAQKWRREKMLLNFLSETKITATEAILILAKSLKKEQRASRDGEESIHEPLISPKLLNSVTRVSAKDAAALTLFHNFSDREIRFIRRYVGGLPAIQEIREKRWSFLNTMPNIYGLNSELGKWEILGNQRTILASRRARTLESVRFSLKECISSRILEFETAGCWPHPPELSSIANEDLSRTVVVLLSVDSGTGTLKMMLRFLTKSLSQNTSDVTLIAEAIGTNESLEDINKHFGPLCSEAENIRSNGILIGSRLIRVEFFFVADFKVIYAVTGGFGSTAKFACPWCQTPSTFFDKTYEELRKKALDHREKCITIAQLEGRMEVKNLIGRREIAQLQRANTFNIFGLERGGGPLRLPTNIVPPTLHIHIGIVNKIFKPLDEIVCIWKAKMGAAGCTQTPADNLLAHALARCGARRESYYAGQLSGVPCTNLMRRMPSFCALFFHRRAAEWGIVTDSVPSTLGLERGLKELAGMYTGSMLKNKKGIEFYLRTQQIWNAGMVTEYDFLVSRFIVKLREAIGREPSRGKVLRESQLWRQPLKMPKLHCMAVHCIQFVESHGFLGAFAEQSFEHFQQTSGKMRMKRAGNKCSGGQICDDMQYSWLHSSPLLRKACSDAEERRSVVSNTIRKRKFPFE